jgi:hypothetical protein
MYNIRFECQRGSKQSNLEVAGCAVLALFVLIHIADNKLKVICPLFSRNGIPSAGNLIRAGGQ